MSVVKILPPLVMSDADLDWFVEALEDVVAKAERPARAYARFGWTLGRSARRRRAASAAPASAGSASASRGSRREMTFETPLPAIETP